MAGAKEAPWRRPGTQALLGAVGGQEPRPWGSNTDLRVVKTLGAGARGAKALSAAYGDALVCIRHRIDPTGTWRLTTVELVVAERAIAQKPSPQVNIRTLGHERQLHAQLQRAGAVWNYEQRVWRMRRATALALGLKKRIVP